MRPKAIFSYRQGIKRYLQQIIKVLPKDQKNILISSQRKWLIFRDEYAGIYAKMYEGGSIAPLAVYNCKSESTSARVKQLQYLYNEEER